MSVFIIYLGEMETSSLQHMPNRQHKESHLILRECK